MTSARPFTPQLRLTGLNRKRFLAEGVSGCSRGPTSPSRCPSNEASAEQLVFPTSHTALIPPYRHQEKAFDRCCPPTPDNTPGGHRHGSGKNRVLSCCRYSSTAPAAQSPGAARDQGDPSNHTRMMPWPPTRPGSQSPISSTPSRPWPSLRSRSLHRGCTDEQPHRER